MITGKSKVRGEITCSKFVKHYDGNETRCDQKANFHAVRGDAYATIDIGVRSAIRHFLKRNSDEYPSPMNGFRLVMNSP